MTQTIHIEGLDRLLAKLERLGKMDAAKNAIRAAGAHVQAAAKVYPGRRHIPMRWVSLRQRNWFFAALRSGAIQVPYKRTSTLKKQWRVTTKDNGLTAVVNNATPYGPYVQGAMSQYWMHRASGWQTTSQIVDSEKRAVVEMVTQEIRKAING